MPATDADSYRRAFMLRTRRKQRAGRGPEPQVAGDYTTQRDGGIEYRYEGSWFLAGRRLVWRARIYRNGKFIAVTHSDTEQAGDEEPVGTIKRAITSAIEGLRYDAV